MRELEKRLQEVYRWWREDKKDIVKNHVSRLHDHAKERIAGMRQEGYTSGELNEEINGIEYRGWWELVD